MGGAVTTKRTLSSDEEFHYYSIDGVTPGKSKDILFKEVTNHVYQNRIGLVNPNLIDIPYITRYPYQEYKFLQKLAIGKYSTVFKASHVNNSKICVVIKEIRVKDMPKIEFSDFRYELNLLSQLSHPSITKLEAVYDPSGPSSKFYVVTEYLRGGELINALIRNQSYSEEDIIHYSFQIISGIHYLHSRGVVHGNIIPENIVLQHQDVNDRERNHVKIVGFDLSECQHTKRSVDKGMIDEQFRAPELFVSKNKSLKSDSRDRGLDQLDFRKSFMKSLTGNRVEQSSMNTTTSAKSARSGDIWSFGAILYLLLSGTLPFQDNKCIRNMNPTTLMEGTWSKISFAAKDLVCKILHPDPNQRISSYEIINNEWILADNDQSNLEELELTTMITAIERNIAVQNNEVNTIAESILAGCVNKQQQTLSQRSSTINSGKQSKGSAGMTKCITPAILCLNENIPLLEKWRNHRFTYLKRYMEGNLNEFQRFEVNEGEQTFTKESRNLENLLDDANHIIEEEWRSKNKGSELGEPQDSDNSDNQEPPRYERYLSRDVDAVSDTEGDDSTNKLRHTSPCRLERTQSNKTVTRSLIEPLEVSISHRETDLSHEGSPSSRSSVNLTSSTKSPNRSPKQSITSSTTKSNEIVTID